MVYNEWINELHTTLQEMNIKHEYIKFGEYRTISIEPLGNSDISNTQITKNLIGIYIFHGLTGDDDTIFDRFKESDLYKKYYNYGYTRLQYDFGYKVIYMARYNVKKHDIIERLNKLIPINYGICIKG